MRALAVVDQFTRECLLLLADWFLTAAKVSAALDRVIAERGTPESITAGNDGDFASSLMDCREHLNGIALDFIRPDQAGRERFIESLNGRLRDELLNVSIFVSLSDAREKLSRWRNDFNAIRPHSALNDWTPNEFRTLWEKTKPALNSPAGRRSGLGGRKTRLLSWR